MHLAAFVEQFIYAVLVGALVGIEREHTRLLVRQKDISFPKKDVLIFGLRTTILFSVLGFLCSFVAGMTNTPAIIAVGLVLAIIITTAVYISNVWLTHHAGATTYIAMFIVFFSGVIIGFGGTTNYMIAAALSITTTFFLLAKRRMVDWTRKLTNEEIFSALKFGIIAFIVLPLLPNRFIDPWNILNPYKIWYIIVLISAIYFVSYICMKVFAQKGLMLSSFFGGLVSGTATVYQISDWLRKKAGLLASAISSVFVACFAGQIGDLIVLSFVFANTELLRHVFVPYLMSITTLILFTFFNSAKKRNRKEMPIKMKSPFALMPALRFGGLYLLLVALGGLLDIFLGHYGLLPTTILGSLFSSSAVIASLSNLSIQGTIQPNVAAGFVILAASTALLIKTFWIQHAKRSKFTKPVFIGTFSAAAVMIITFAIQSLFL